MTNVITAKRLFREIFGQLITNNCLPSCVEDIIRRNEDEVIDFNMGHACVGELYKGSIEGAYVHLYLDCIGHDHIPLGTFRTTSDSRRAWEDMARLLADAVWVGDDILRRIEMEGIALQKRR